MVIRVTKIAWIDRPGKSWLEWKVPKKIGLKNEGFRAKTTHIKP